MFSWQPSYVVDVRPLFVTVFEARKAMDKRTQEIDFWRTKGKQKDDERVLYSDAIQHSSFKIPLNFQCFKHSNNATFVSPNDALSHVIVRRAPEKTRSTSSLIAGMDKISIAIHESLGHRFL
jgi:hypothetical protein